MPLKTALSTVVLSLVLCGTAHARDPIIIGVGTHLMNYDTSPTRALQLVCDAGITSVRDDAFWSIAEPERNQWQIVPQWRMYLNTAQGKHLSPVTILDYGSNFHGNLKPRTPEIKTAYLKYVDYVTRQLTGRVAFWEVWNEWDLEGPKDAKLADDYATLVKEVAPLIRKNDPNAKILAGSVTPEGMDGGFADHLIDAGALDQIDGLSIHPYVHCAGMGHNTPESWLIWVRDYLHHVNEKAGREVPIYMTEIGWPSHQGNCGNTPETISSYLARSYFLARTLPSVKGMWWYDLMNDGLDPHEQEHNFGLLDHSMEPKPSYNVLKAISPFIRDYTYDPGPSTMMNDVYLLYFNKGEERVVVGWAAGRTQEKDVVTNAPLNGKLQWIDTAHPTKGRTTSDTTWNCTGDQCTALVTLTNFPKIISLNASPSVAKR